MNIKQKTKALARKTSAIFLAWKKKETPIYAKIVAAITVIYALSPIDLIPDFIPILGYLDDLIILPILISIALKLIPKKVMAICEIEAAEIWKEGKPKKWYFAVPIILVWVIVLIVILINYII